MSGLCRQVDLSCMEDVESLGDHGCTVKAFDELLAAYSAKALEFQVVQMERSQTRGELLFFYSERDIKQATSLPQEIPLLLSYNQEARRLMKY